MKIGLAQKRFYIFAEVPCRETTEKTGGKLTCLSLDAISEDGGDRTINQFIDNGKSKLKVRVAIQLKLTVMQILNFLCNLHVFCARSYILNLNCSLDIQI